MGHVCNGAILPNHVAKGNNARASWIHEGKRIVLDFSGCRAAERAGGNDIPACKDLVCPRHTRSVPHYC